MTLRLVLIGIIVVVVSFALDENSYSSTTRRIRREADAENEPAA
jgi:hypothetical protein